MHERFTIGLELELHKKPDLESDSAWYLLYVWNTETSKVVTGDHLGAKLNHKTVFQNDYVWGTLECWGHLPGRGQSKLELVTPDECATDKDKVERSRAEMYCVAGRLLEFVALPFDVEPVGSKSSPTGLLTTWVEVEHPRLGKKEYARSLKGFVTYYNDRLEDEKGKATPLKYVPLYKSIAFLFEPVQANALKSKAYAMPRLYSQMTVSMPLEVIPDLFEAEFGVWDIKKYSLDAAIQYLFCEAMRMAAGCASGIVGSLIKDQDEKARIGQLLGLLEERELGGPKFLDGRSPLEKTLQTYWKKGTEAAGILDIDEREVASVASAIFARKLTKPMSSRKRLKVLGFFSIVAYVVISYVLIQYFRVGGRKDQFVFLPKTRLNDLWREGLSLADKVGLGVAVPDQKRAEAMVATIKNEVRRTLKDIAGRLGMAAQKRRIESRVDWNDFVKHVDEVLDDDSYFTRWKGPVQAYLESIFLTNDAEVYATKAIALLDGFRMLHSTQVDTTRALGGLEKVVLEYRRAGDYEDEGKLAMGIEEKKQALTKLHDVAYKKHPSIHK
ncbi:MAG TPA: hypothetical protein VHM70_29880 [Polyangiaceae bacterium]|jgi:hypothetical protein|nr:hypothetical protein [Polyangiaceae bacterium]